MNDFFDDVNSRKHYDYNVLIYGNYTYRENLEADSLVEVLRHVIPFMSKRWNIHFTIPIPEFVGSLNFPNVDQVNINLPTYCNQMRTHFDSIEFMNIFDWRHRDWDIVYSHLPEHTTQISNCLHNNSNLYSKIIGYSHWFEVPENAPYSKTMLDFSISGMLHMEECGVNSDWLKQLVIKNASINYNDNILKKLDKIIQTHYLGVDRINVRKQYNDKTVIFNHRGAGYTGWDHFIKLVDKIYESRQDFTVYTTMADTNRPWHKRVKLKDRQEYMNFLSKMKFGVGTFQTYSAWSISTTDGFSVGVPYLLPNKLCYPEMVGVSSKPYPYLYDNDEEFIKKFNLMLDEQTQFDTTEIAKSMLWEERISKWFNGWNDVFEFKAINETDALKNIKSIIKKHKYIEKNDLLQELNWGVQIKWSGYRNALRNDPNYKLTKTGYEYIK